MSGEQFSPIPVRAFSDTRLSAADFRVMGAIAYFDRLGRNGLGCFADPRKLAEHAAVAYSHLARHTRRLQDFDYLEIGRSATDRRKRVYSLIYNEEHGVVANIGDNLDGEPSRGANHDTEAEKVAISGDNLAEKVANPKSQAVGPQAKSVPKRSCETDLRNPAKPRASGARNAAADGPPARQGDRGGGDSTRQRYLKMPITGGNQKPETKPREPDWTSWAHWIERARSMSYEGALNWIMAEIERIASERGVDPTEAAAILDWELRLQKEAAA